MSKFLEGTIKVINNFTPDCSFLATEQLYHLDIEIFNLSATDWFNDLNCRLNISYHWLTPTNDILIWDGIRTPIHCETIPKSKSHKTTVAIVSPKDPGNYILVLTLLHENFYWFENCGFTPLKMEVTVEKVAKKKFVVIGNCQGVELARIMQSMTCDTVETQGIMTTTLEALENVLYGKNDIYSLMEQSDVIFIHPGQLLKESISKKFPELIAKVKEIPRIIFSAFHPDLCYIYTKDETKSLQGPMIDYQSALAFYGWTNGFSINETIQLFTPEVFQHLGYFDYHDSSKEFLLAEGEQCNFSLQTLVQNWQTQQCWMHSSNHPKLFVLIDLAKEILTREKITISQSYDANTEYDFFGNNAPIWPVYPDIAKRMNIENGNYTFKWIASEVNLEQFITASFELFSRFSVDNLQCDAIETLRFQQLKDFLAQPKMEINEAEIPTESNDNPYSKLPNHQFWRRAVEQLPMGQVDPVVSAPYKINITDKVATAGSCFAQHISKNLQAKGFNYFIAETAEGMSTEEAGHRNYGVFSARYGNIYTSRQLLQLFDRAYGHFKPIDNAWLRKDGKYVDPYRPQIELDGFDSIEELEQSREMHFQSVRKMFENLDIFVFTLGLTEAWRNKTDGAIYPLAPGVVAGKLQSHQEFINFSVMDVISDLEQFIAKLSKINPRAKIIFTVSPVPLIATYENTHVLPATTYSKSVLRVAAHEICQRNALCHYFPSYEIITGAYTRGNYFETDLRSVTAPGVDHVMRLFFKHYTGIKANSLTDDLKQLNSKLSEIICDEEAITR